MLVPILVGAIGLHPWEHAEQNDFALAHDSDYHDRSSQFVHDNNLASRPIAFTMSGNTPVPAENERASAGTSSASPNPTEESSP